MGGGEGFLRNLFELLAERRHTDPFFLYGIVTGIVFPVAMVFYAAVSYALLFLPRKLSHKKQIWLRIAWGTATVLLIAVFAGAMAYACV